MRKLTFVIAVVLWLSGQSQSPAVRFYNTENGLPTNTVYSIFQNGDGNIYAGTDIGVVQFNGQSSKRFDAKNVQSKAATSFVCAPDRTVYGINFNGQLLKWDTVLTVFNTPHTFISQITCDSLNRVWICGDKGLSVLYPGSNQVESVKKVNDVLSLERGMYTGSPCVVQDSVVWFTGIDYVYRWDGKTLAKFRGDFNSKIQGTAMAYALYCSGGEWYMMHQYSQRILKLENNYFKEIRMPGLEVLPAQAKLTNLVLLNDFWWICTYNGVLRLDPLSGKSEHWFRDKVITDVHCDHEGNYWFSTLYDGLLWSADLSIMQWGANRDAHFVMCASNGITCLAAKQNGDLFIMDSVGNSAQIKRDQNSDIQYMAWNETGGYYEIAANGYLYKVVNGATVYLSVMYSSLRCVIYSSDHSVYCSKSGTFTRNIGTGDVDSDTLSIVASRGADFSSSGNKLAVASYAGLQLYGRHRQEYSLERTLFPDSVIYSVCRGFTEDEWFFVTVSGVVYNTKRGGSPQVFYRPEEGWFVGQMKNSGNRIWITSNKGLIFFEAGSSTSNVIGHTDGLSSNAVGYITQYGHQLYICTAGGINSFPSNLRVNRSLPILRLNFLSVNEQIISLPYSDDYLEVSYKATISLGADIIGYAAEQGYEIGYRFSKAVEEWNFVKLNNGVISFSGFPQGDWILQLVVRDEFGNISRVTDVIEIHVVPPFWQTWWFYSGLIILILLIAVMSFTFYVRRLRKRQLAELKQLKLVSDLNLSQQTALSAQMNPHFIFNVLNSIKGFIYQNDRKNATHYLNNFSDLVRRVLSMSGVRLIRLSEELEMIRLYVDLEASLLKPPFEFRLEIDPDTEPSDISIPSLIVQPFVENAFKHGLRHKTDKKVLLIRVAERRQENYLEIIIEDNGIGRHAAGIADQPVTEKKSFAVSASRRRLELLNSERADLVGLEIADLYDEQGAPAGTRVILKITLS